MSLDGLSKNKIRLTGDVAAQYYYITILMQIIFCIKMYTVFYYSSRNISLGWPLDGLVFDPFHRFTDWLTVYGASMIRDPYITSPTGATGPPYGYSLLYIVSLAHYFGPRHYYFYMVLIFTCINYAIYAKAIPGGLSLKSASGYMSIIVVLYPLYFMIDRGNADIVASVLISLLFLLLMFNYKNKEFVIATLLSFITSLKPSLLLFALPLLFMFRLKVVLLFLVINLTVYLYPVIMLGEKLLYMPTLIISAQKILGDNPIMFHHDLALVLSIFNVKIPSMYVAAFIIASCLLFLAYIKYFVRRVDVGLVVALVAEITMLANHPSPDYRMLLLFPIYFYITFVILKIGIMSSADKIIFIVSFVFAMSFDNIPINENLVYVSVLRFLGITMALYLTVKQMLVYGKKDNVINPTFNNA
jgi:hypothetical protein